ncbi:MAG: hypothetical protein II262_06170 [Alistipes sp.]|jgi:hypothetical protein|nr:hypothetical protein [Alistipes sp.]
MKKYLLRSLKYFLTLCVLLVALIWIKIKYESLPVTFLQMVEIYFSQWNGWAMAATMILLSATYPLFGFVRRVVSADITADRQQIEAAMATVGLELCSATDSALTFRATGLQRLTLLFEDEVTVTLCSEGVVISGHRRTVVRAVIRLEGYLTHKRRDE